MSGFKMDDYVDVAQRIDMFAEKHPDGSLQSELTFIPELSGWLCKAFAYRGPDDIHPGVGHAFEPVPGKTPYTRDSEAMNAETSAWGRAIVALGFKTKKIASADEVRNRQPSAADRSTTNGDTPKVISEAQRKRLYAMSKEAALSDEGLKALVKEIAGVDSSKEIPVSVYDQLCGAVEAEGTPF